MCFGIIIQTWSIFRIDQSFLGKRFERPWSRRQVKPQKLGEDFHLSSLACREHRFSSSVLPWIFWSFMMPRLGPEGFFVMAPGCVLWKLPRLKSLSRDFCCSTRGTKLWLVSFREILSTGKLGKSVSDFHKFWKTTPSYEKPKADIGSMDARCLSLWSLERLKKKRTGLTVEFLPRTQRRIYWISLKRSMKLQRHPLKQIMKIWWWEMDLLRSPFWIMSLTQAGKEFWWQNCKHVSPLILLKEREGSKEWCYMIYMSILTDLRLWIGCQFGVCAF